MPEKRLPGWVIAVWEPAASIPKRYAVVADNAEDAKGLVGDHLAVTNQRVEFERVLTAGEVERRGLKPGEVEQFD
jgi:hypothetical protein